MKRFSKMLVLGLSAALVFGMTAQADGSVSAGEAPATAEAAKNEVTLGGSTTVVVDGQEVTVEIEAPTVLEETKYEEVKAEVKTQAVVTKVQDKIKEAVKANLKEMVPDSLKEQSSGKTVELVGEPKVTAAFNLEAPKGLTQAQIEKGVQVPFTLKAVKSNVIYSVIHYLAGGGYEVLPATVKGSTIYATFNSFSPVVIVEQEIKLVGEDTPASSDNNNSNNNSSNDNNSSSAPQDASKAPKTGEALPVAAVMAVVLMAGAAFCAKKVRYNR